MIGDLVQWVKEKNGTIQNISIRNFISTGRGVAIDQDLYPGCKLISIPYQVLITGPQILTEFRGKYIIFLTLTVTVRNDYNPHDTRWQWTAKTFIMACLDANMLNLM